MISFLSSSNRSQSIRVYLDGKDAEFFKKLSTKLGSETRAQEAIILEGYLTKLKRSKQVSREEVERVERLWPKVIGLSKEAFDRRIMSEDF